MRRLWKGLRNEYVWLEKVRKVLLRARLRAPRPLSLAGSRITCARARVSIRSDQSNPTRREESAPGGCGEGGGGGGFDGRSRWAC